MNELNNIVFRINDTLALNGFTMQFTLFTLILAVLVEVVYLGYFIYSAYKHNDIFYMGEDKPMIYILLGSIYALIYITGGSEASLYTTLALGFVLIIVKHEKYRAIKEYIDMIF